MQQDALAGADVMEGSRDEDSAWRRSRERGQVRLSSCGGIPSLSCIGLISARLGLWRQATSSGITAGTSNRPTTPSSRRDSSPSRQRSSGYITAVPVTDNQHVAAGDVIARIDDRDYRIALDQARRKWRLRRPASRTSMRNQVQQAQIISNEAQVEQAQAALVFAEQQTARYQDLAQKGSGTVQNAQQYTSQLRQQQAALASCAS